ncbi:MAG: NUDIX domain-containing protein [Bacteroidota bacterium]
MTTTSAGGIILRHESDIYYVVVVELVNNVEKKWAPILRQLPKGRCEKGETFEETALREVFEETGYKTKIISKAGEAKWSYYREDVFWEETVHYFFMTPLSLSAEQHDREFDYVQWMPIEEVCEKLSYPEERQLINHIFNHNSHKFV